jgi:hypothetical protein
MPPFSGNFIEHIFQRQAQSTWKIFGLYKHAKLKPKILHVPHENLQLKLNFPTMIWKCHRFCEIALLSENFHLRKKNSSLLVFKIRNFYCSENRKTVTVRSDIPQKLFRSQTTFYELFCGKINIYIYKFVRFRCLFWSNNRSLTAANELKNLLYDKSRVVAIFAHRASHFQSILRVLFLCKLNAQITFFCQ